MGQRVQQHPMSRNLSPNSLAQQLPTVRVMRDAERRSWGSAGVTEAMPTNMPSNIWEGDLLDRSSDARIVIDFTSKRVDELRQLGAPGCIVLNLDAQWGEGKTYFLQRLAMQLDEEGYLAAYVNAWEDDHVSDPLVAVIAAVDKKFRAKFLASHRQRRAWDAAKKNGVKIAIVAGKNAALVAAKKIIGQGVDEISEIVDEDLASKAGDAAEKAAVELLDKQTKELLKKFDESKDLIQKFRESLFRATSSDEQKRPMFILIDELDRCRPAYAIALLERIKHLFNVDGVVFVLATDTSQLRHATTAVYGAAFHGGRYLRRFFDSTYRFADPDLRPFAARLFARFSRLDALSSPPGFSPESTFVALVERCGLSLRDSAQYFEKLQNVITLWKHPSQAELVPLLTLLIAEFVDPDSISRCKAGDFKSLASLGKVGSERAVKFVYWSEQGDPFNRERKVEEVDILDLAVRIFERSQTDLVKIVRAQPGYGCNGWIQERFREEVNRARYVTSHDKTLLSYVSNYPSLVLNAARFVQVGP